MVNANEIGYGVELETTMPTSDTTIVGGYHNGLPVSWLPAGWKNERDSSIQTLVPNRKGVEYISPILKGLDGLNQIRTACDTITARGGRVNASCGLHVTVSFDGDAAALARLICLVGNHEKAMYASTGTHRREAGTYCKPIKGYNDSEVAKTRLSYDRYHCLNLTHISSGKNRVEFRCFAGTLNADKIAGYVQLCVGLVQLAIESSRPTPWNWVKGNSVTGFLDRMTGGLGENELNRLYYRLGWIKGYHKGRLAGRVFGGFEGTDRKAARAAMITMAKKYDTGN